MIKRGDVEQMAKLAKIDLDEREIESLQGDLSDIVNYIDKIKKLNLSDVLLLDHSIIDKLDKNVTRDDIGVDYNDRDGLIDDFSARDGKHLKVKPIL